MDQLQETVSASESIASLRSRLLTNARASVRPSQVQDLFEVPIQQLEFQAEDVEAERVETLYSAFTSPEFIPRKTEPKDITTLMGYVRDETRYVFGRTADAGLIYEKSCFSLVLVDQIETGKVVAHASFNDRPMDPVINMDNDQWRTIELEMEEIKPHNTLFLHLLLIHPTYTTDTCLTELISNTFLACNGITTLIVECPSVDYEGPYLFTSLAREVIFSPAPNIEKKLILYEKDKLFPHLTVREGREHDLDDLIPQMRLNAKEMEENFGGRSYLSDLVALSDRNNQTVVAEFESRAVGIAIVTTDINYKFLNHNFHLEAFHGLFRPHRDDVIYIEEQNNMFVDTAAESDEDFSFKDQFIETQVFRVEKPNKEEMSKSEMKISKVKTEEKIADVELKPKPSKVMPDKEATETDVELKSSEVTVTSAKSTEGRTSETVVPSQATEDFERFPLANSVDTIPSGKSKVQQDDSQLHDVVVVTNGNETETPLQQVSGEVKTIKSASAPALTASAQLEKLDVERTSSVQSQILIEDGDSLRILKESEISLGNIATSIDSEVSVKSARSSWFDKVGQNSKPSLGQLMTDRDLVDKDGVPIEKWNEPLISKYVGLPNAIAIQLFTMDHRYHVRFEDLIHNVFFKFPNRDYVVVTVPPEVPEPHWTKYFTMATKRKGSVYTKSLYVLHRITFSSQLEIRIPNEFDLFSIGVFLTSVTEGKKILDDVERSFFIKWEADDDDDDDDDGQEHGPNLKRSLSEEQQPMLPFIMTAQDFNQKKPIVVGLAMISNEPEPAFYQVNYNLDYFAYANDHKPHDYGYIHHFLISPVFQVYSRMFMKEILRHTGKHFAFHRLFPAFEMKHWQNQSMLNNIEDWIPLGPRKRINYNYLNLKDIYDEDRQPSLAAQDYTNPSATLFFSKKFIFEPKPKVGAHIVFVGASETAISALEKLVFGGSQVVFNHLTIISPTGLPGSLEPSSKRDLFFPKTGSPALSMTSSTDDEWHLRLGLKNHVNVVHGTVTKILRKTKMVLVNGSKVVRYDLLIICVGRQFIRPDCQVPEIRDAHFDRYHQSLSVKIASDYIENRVFKQTKAPLKRSSLKPYNVFLINTELDAADALDFLKEYLPLAKEGHIIVHGECLEAYCCITALLRLRADHRRICLVTTPGDDGMDWEQWHGYKDTPKIKEVMRNSLKRLGIRVVENYSFQSWELDDMSNLATRIFFTSPKAEEEANANISISCLAYFPFFVRRVPDIMATVVTESFLPYNKGMLIDTAFQTLDTNIWAAGPCTMYNKALCADKYFHGFYSSYEIGKLVADLIIKKYDPTADICIVNSIKPGQSLLPPLMTAPIVRYAELPGHWYYLHLRRPGKIVQCCHGECASSCPDCECGTDIVTGTTDDLMSMTRQKYFRLWLNSFQRVEGLECISRFKFSPSNLAALYGHHEAFLNKLLENVEKGEIKDLYVHFEQPWVGAICHDRWLDFREELQDTYAEYDVGPNFKLYNFIRDYLDNLDNPHAFKVDSNILRRIFEGSGLKELVEYKFLEFLKYNRAVIPMFARPDFVEEQFEERETSPMYFPQVPNF